MPTFSQGDVVKVPFPYTNRQTRQSRPALVVSAGDIGGADQSSPGLLRVLMITGAQHRGWPGDLVLDDPTGTGLPVPSVIRSAKIATIEAADATGLGRIGDRVQAEVVGYLRRRHLGLDGVA